MKRRNNMKKKLMGLLGIILAGAMMLAGCGESSGSSSTAASTSKPAALDVDRQGTDADASIGEENTDVEPIEKNIAFVCWGYSDTLSMGYQKALNSLTKGLMTLDQPIKINWEWITAISPEEQMSSLEAIHEKGIDGCILVYMSEAIIDQMNEWKMPFASYTTFTDEIESYAAKSPYYIGTVHEGFAHQAEMQIRYAIETAGCKEILFISYAPGLYNHDCRFPVYEEVLAEHPEVTYYMSRSDEQPVDVVSSMLSMHPNIDCVIDTTALGGRGDGVVQALRVAGFGNGEIKYITCDFVEDQVKVMEDGIMVFTSSGTQGSPTHSFVALLNEIMGTPLSDEPMIWDWDFVDIDSMEDYNDFNKYCIGKVPMITFEDYEPFFKWLHPEATAEDFTALCSSENMTIDNIKTKHAKYFE